MSPHYQPWLQRDKIKNTQCWIFHHYQPGLLKLDNTKRSLLNFSLVLIMDTKKYNSKKKHNNKNRNMQNNTHCHPSPHGRSLVQIVRPVQSPSRGSRQTPPCWKVLNENKRERKGFFLSYRWIQSWQVLHENKNENEKGSFSAIDEYKVDKFSMRTKERAVCKPVQLRVNSPRAEVILKVTVPQRPLPLDIIWSSHSCP